MNNRANQIKVTPDQLMTAYQKHFHSRSGNAAPAEAQKSIVLILFELLTDQHFFADQRDYLNNDFFELKCIYLFLEDLK